MESERWISIDERMPGVEDGDEQECVIAWHIWQGILVMKWHQIEKNRFVSHWMPAIAPPANYKEIRKSWENEMMNLYGRPIYTKK